MTGSEKIGYMGKYVHDKEEALAKNNGLIWEDIDKIVGEAIGKGWDREALKQAGIMTTEERVSLLKYIDKNERMIITRCKSSVRDMLKSPASADFPFASYDITLDKKKPLY